MTKIHLKTKQNEKPVKVNNQEMLKFDRTEFDADAKSLNEEHFWPGYWWGKSEGLKEVEGGGTIQDLLEEGWWKWSTFSCKGFWKP